MKKITNQELELLSMDAKLSERKRKNFNFHTDLSDTFQRMLNAMEPGTYVQPHKHENPDKREAFILLKGRIGVITFTDSGEILDYVILDPKNGIYGVEIPEREWHTLVVLEPDSVVFEAKDGPYSPIDDKNFASWAPKEGSPECRLYLNEILKKINNRS